MVCGTAAYAIAGIAAKYIVWTTASSTPCTAGTSCMWVKTSDDTPYWHKTDNTNTSMLGGGASTGNYTFSTNTMDLSGAAAMSIAPTTANAITLGQNTTISGSKTFTTGTGTNTINGAVSVASGVDMTAAGGASDIDWSASSGVFKTPTGVSTFGGSANNFTNSVKAPQYISTSSAPSLAAGAANNLGTLTGVSVSGTNEAGIISFTTGTVGTISNGGNSAATSEVLKLTFSGGYTAPTACVVDWFAMGTDSTAASYNWAAVRNNFANTNAVWGVCSTTTCSMYFDSTVSPGGWANSTAYKIGYRIHCW